MRESTFFAARAEACHADAVAATLDNVRDRCLRAEKAWAVMAERSLRVETARDSRVAPSAGTAAEA